MSVQRELTENEREGFAQMDRAYLVSLLTSRTEQLQQATERAAKAEVECERLDGILERHLICSQCGCSDTDSNPDCLCTSDDCGCPIIAREKADSRSAGASP